MMKYLQPATKDINVQLIFKKQELAQSEMKLKTGLVRKLPKIYSQGYIKNTKKTEVHTLHNILQPICL